MIRLTYTRDGRDTDMEIPLLPGETWEEGFARVHPIISAAMGIPPRPDVDAVTWERIKARAHGLPMPEDGTERAAKARRPAAKGKAKQ